MVDQGLARHAKIAVSMIRRHKPFVAPKKMNFLPIERRAQIREQLVNALRCRAAGKAKAKTFGRTGRARGDKACDPQGQGFRVAPGVGTGAGVTSVPVRPP